MNEVDAHYPADSCPFCSIAGAFPSPEEHQPQQQREQQQLSAAVPDELECEPERTSPSSFVVLRSPHVLAFLDILPMTAGMSFSPCFSCFCWGRWKSEAAKGREQGRGVSEKNGYCPRFQRGLGERVVTVAFEHVLISGLTCEITR